jgi:signal transduction histidine kinase
MAASGGSPAGSSATGSEWSLLMPDPVERLHRFIFTLTATLLFLATLLRALLYYADDPILPEVVLLLAAWLALVAGEYASSSRQKADARWRTLFPLVVATEAAIVVVLLASTYHGDYFAVLFGVISMRVMQRQGWRLTVGWIALFFVATTLALTASYAPAEALAFGFINAVIAALLAFFTYGTTEAMAARSHNVELIGRIEAANREIAAYSLEVEGLAATRERHRLARELHDSVTQTVFSMNLTAQSAALLLPRDRGAAVAQLDRLEELTQGALAEIRALGSELAPAPLVEGGLAEALRRHLGERGLLKDAQEVSSDDPARLRVTLTVDEGEAETLTESERHSLYRIAQEALNNIVKHAQAGRATIRLGMSPPRLEISDDGRGFDLQEGERSGGMGLAGMKERAAEIGWSLDVSSSSGRGTSIVVESRGEPAHER